MEITYSEYLKSIGEPADGRPKFSSKFVHENIFLDGFDGWEHPRGYFYVRIEDMCALCDMADSIRQEEGYENLVENCEYVDEDWNYDFYIEFHKDGKIKLSFIVNAYELDDNEAEYYVDLTEEEQDVIFKRLQHPVERDFNIVLIRTPGQITWYKKEG